MNNIKVFLGGTCNNDTWRDEIIPKLEENNIGYFNPIVADWNDEAKRIEEDEKDICDFNLFVITSKMTGVYSIAEVIDRVHYSPFTTIFIVLEDGFSESQIKSLNAVKDLVKRRNGIVLKDLNTAVSFLKNMNQYLKICLEDNE